MPRQLLSYSALTIPQQLINKKKKENNKKKKARLEGYIFYYFLSLDNYFFTENQIIRSRFDQQMPAKLQTGKKTLSDNNSLSLSHRLELRSPLLLQNIFCNSCSCKSINIQYRFCPPLHESIFKSIHVAGSPSS